MLEYTYYPDTSCIITKITGYVKLDEVYSYIDRVIEDDKIDKPFYEIVDFSNIENFDFGYYESNNFITKLKDMKDQKGCKGSILIADNDLTQGMSNMFQSIGECKGVKVYIVHSLDEAMDNVVKNAS